MFTLIKPVGPDKELPLTGPGATVLNQSLQQRNALELLGLLLLTVEQEPLPNFSTLLLSFQSSTHPQKKFSPEI